MKLTTRDIILEALISVLYIIVTLLTSSFSFGVIQFRIAEVLLILVFFNKKHSIGIVLGCLISNILSPIGAFDILIGTIATILSCLCLCFIKQLGLALILTIAINAFIVGAELYFLMHEPFWLSVGFVALGEFTVLIVGYLLTIFVLRKRNDFMKVISANQNIDFKW